MGSYGISLQGKMLANIAAMFWGSSEPEVEGTTGAPQETTETEESPSKTLLTYRARTPSQEEESDWVLVDRAASPSSVLTPEPSEGSPMREEAPAETQTQQEVAVPTPPRNRVAQRAANLLQAIDVLRPAQKAQRRREERRLKAKHLERGNKAREVACAGNKRSRRQDLMTPAKFSRVVNNRKC